MSATTLGRMMRTVREMPMVARASISSVTCMTPIWAVMADPERPATSTATRTGPSLRMIEMPRMLTMKVGAEGLELEGRQVADGDADEKADQGGNRQAWAPAL